MVDLNERRFIKGAPAGVFASLCPATFALNVLCEKCLRPIEEADDKVWYCSYYWLGKRGKQKANPKEGCAHWHYDCLEAGPVSVAFL